MSYQHLLPKNVSPFELALLKESLDKMGSSSLFSPDLPKYDEFTTGHSRPQELGRNPETDPKIDPKRRLSI